jgi:hypothetical protein
MKLSIPALTLPALLFCSTGKAQTDIDGLMMAKNNFCTGPMYQYSAWKNYWEGSLNRENLNLGTVSTQTIAIMGNYGITRRLNALFTVPYVKTNASAGQWKGQAGIQDLSLWLKYMPFEKKVGPGELSLYTIGGFSTPLTNYSIDQLPLSLGLGSTNTTLRLMADYQWGDWFGTASGSYVVRSNVKLDRTAYYTTEMNYTNEVKMPNATQYNLRAGFRNGTWIAEAVLDHWNTLGGHDITRNNMPFVSNNMDATRLGANFKRENAFTDGLSFIWGGSYTVAGRNMGQSTAAYAAVVYILDFSPKQKQKKQDEAQQ